MSSKFHAKTTRDKVAPRKGNNNTPDYLQIYIKNVLLLYFFFSEPFPNFNLTTSKFAAKTQWQGMKNKIISKRL